MVIWKRSDSKYSRLLSLAPWILGIACLTLLLVLAFFAVSNFKRERELLVGTLEQKGLTLIRFIESSVRESVRENLLTQQRWQTWEVHMAAALELAAEQPGVETIYVTDIKGNILLKTPPKGSGDDIDHITSDIQSLAADLAERKGMPGRSSHVVSEHNSGDKDFFIAALHLVPRFQGMGRHRGMRRHFINHQSFEDVVKEMQHLRTLRPMFIIQLDFKEFDTPLKKQFFQIILQLVVISLVGIGGALSFITLKWLKGTEKHLHQVTAFNESIVSSLPVGLLAVSDDGVIRISNNSVSDLLGITREKLIDQPMDTVLAPELVAMLENIYEQAQGGLEEDIVLDIGGQKKYLNLVSTTVPYRKEKSMGRVLLIRDLTSMRTLEKELQRNERLASLGKMAAGIAHELRNPLSSIKGLAILLQPHFPSGSSEAKNSDTLIKEVDRLNRGICELLDFARPTPLKKEGIQIEDVIRKTMTLVDADARSYNISTKVSCDEGLPTLYVDSDKISQVLLNVFLNAIQAMEVVASKRKGVLVVRVERNNNEIVIQTRDNGQGIEPDSLTKVFDPYFTTKSEGTGLGLALSAKIIEEHGGRVEANSVFGEYTEVLIGLPIQPTDKA